MERKTVNQRTKLYPNKKNLVIVSKNQAVLNKAQEHKFKTLEETNRNKKVALVFNPLNKSPESILTFLKRAKKYNISYFEHNSVWDVDIFKFIVWFKNINKAYKKKTGRNTKYLYVVTPTEQEISDITKYVEAFCEILFIIIKRKL